MQLRQSQRQKAKIKLALQGITSSGKSYSALLLAYGLTADWNKIAVIDTENGSADLYAHLGSYQVLSLQPPYSPEKYTEAIRLCERAGIEVIILDSISHCWDFLLDYHASLQGNSFTNWAKINPRLKTLMDAILQSPCHVISTLRVKQDYVLNQRSDGKLIPEKVGLKSVMKDGLDYEFTLVFELDGKHNATCAKDRTGLFVDKPAFTISPETGRQIKAWCNSGIGVEDVRKLIAATDSIDKLNGLYHQYSCWYSYLEPDFTARKQQLQNPVCKTVFNHIKTPSPNGTANNQPARAAQ